MLTRTASNPSNAPPRRTRRVASFVTASALVILAGLVFGLGSCTAALGLDGYGSAADEMCGLLERCDAKSVSPRCSSRIGDYLTTARNIVFDARTKNRTPICLVGVKDSIIVQTDDATLVAAKSEAQKIKQLVAKLGADKKLSKLV